MHFIKPRSTKVLAASLVFFLTTSLAGCGTLIYPDRRGQTGGRIDPAVAILDGVGLLVFIIPGLVAFAIDFATGAIYLPDTSHATLDPADATVMHLSDANLSPEYLRQVIEQQTGHPFSFYDPNLQAYRFKSRAELQAAIYNE